MNRMNAKSWTTLAAMTAVALAGAQSTRSDEPSAPTSGPVRLARISYADGNVSWRPDDRSSWSQATPNLPLQQGAQIWVTGRGRAEIQFDDGSDVRLGNNAVATLQSLYSDTQGEFTELKLNDGTSSLHLKDKYSIYQIDTPYESVKAAGPARFRVDVGDEVRVGVRTGSATLSAGGGDTNLRSGDFVVTRSSNDSVRVENLPRADSWDRFDDDREDALNGGTEHLPPNIAIVAGGIDHYGHWRHEDRYGWVWCPSVSASWRPYHYGHWVWCDPFGWTWCSDEAWGWAPYHYGTWSHFGWGWGWCPGPYHQYWSPAVVSFTSYNGDFCWTPLCPEEVVYPAAFGIGFGSGNWWFNFSIGGCGIYRPGFDGRCNPVAFGPRDWDRRNWDRRRDDVGRWGTNDAHFIPRNANWGASAASEHGFGQGGRFREVRGNASQYFERGHAVTASGHAFSGPVNASWNQASITPTHTFRSTETPTAINRSLYRAPVSGAVGRTGEPFGHTVNGNGASNSDRRGSYVPRIGGSAVDRARQSIGYSGRGFTRTDVPTVRTSTYNSSGDRAYRGTSNRTIERSNGGSSGVESARRSLGYSGSRPQNSDSGSSSSRRSSYSNDRASGYSYSGRYHSDSQGSSSRSTSSSGRGYGSRGDSSSSGRSSRSSDSGGSRGGSSRDSGGSRGGDSGGARGGGSGGGGRGRN